MARHPSMKTADGRWTVEVIRGRTGRQSFRVKDNYRVASDTWAPTGKLVATVDEVKAIIGEAAYATLREDRSGRFDGGR